MFNLSLKPCVHFVYYILSRNMVLQEKLQLYLVYIYIYRQFILLFGVMGNLYDITMWHGK